MDLQLRLSAAPAVQFIRPDGTVNAGSHDGFSLQVNAILPYPAINQILFAYLGGKRFDLSEGLINTHIIIQKGMVEADAAGDLLIQAHFTGTFNGSIYIKGKPQYDATLKAIRLTQLTYDLESTSLLLRLGKSLLASKIGEELANRSLLPLEPYFQKAEKAINENLQKQWTPGIRTTGKVQEILVQSVNAEQESLVVQMSCTGNLVMAIQV